MYLVSWQRAADLARRQYIDASIIFSCTFVSEPSTGYPFASRDRSGDMEINALARYQN